jgi:transposase-like protein
VYSSNLSYEEKQTCRKFSHAFKAKVAPEAVKNQQTFAELAKKFNLNSVVISKWKAAFLENLSATFERSDSNDVQDQDTEKRYAAIGQLKVENEFLKKSCKRLGIEI